MDPEDPKYAPASITSRQNTMIGVTIAMTLLGALTVALRVFTRAYIVGTMWADDWAMVATMLFAFGYALEVLIATKSFNAGYSGAELAPDDMVGIIKITMAIIVTYKMVLTLTKISILCFYLRIAVRPTFEKLSKWTMGVVIMFQVILTFGTIGQCVPIEKNWDLTGTVKGKCINTTVFYHFASVFHIVTDVWILFLPYKLVMSIARPLKERLGIFAIFGLGGITIVAAIFRLQFLHNYTVSQDPFFEIVPIHIWSMVEVNIGILCASLPTLRPLISQAQRSRTREIRGFTIESKSKEKKGTVGTLATSGTIAIGIGTTIRGSYRPPVPPKSPSYTGTLSPIYSGKSSPTYSDGDSKSLEYDLERNTQTLAPPGPRRLALLRRDENGIFRPERVYRKQ